jgi:hypothetical protein
MLGDMLGDILGDILGDMGPHGNWRASGCLQ